jgi:hypothetical protein
MTRLAEHERKKMSTDAERPGSTLGPKAAATAAAAAATTTASSQLDPDGIGAGAGTGGGQSTEEAILSSIDGSKGQSYVSLG